MVEGVAEQVGAAAVPGLHQALDLQDDHGLLDGGAADPEALGQVAFGGQAVAGGEAVLGGVGAEAFENLLVEAGTAHRAQRVVGHA